MNSFAKRLLSLLSVLALLFLFLPVLVLFIRGIGTRGWQGLPTTGVTQAILISLLTTTVSAGLTVLFGTPLAYVFARNEFRFKRLLNVLVELPIVLPPAVAGLALLITFGRRGLLGPLLDTRRHQPGFYHRRGRPGTDFRFGPVLRPRGSGRLSSRRY